MFALKNGFGKGVGACVGKSTIRTAEGEALPLSEAASFKARSAAYFGNRNEATWVQQEAQAGPRKNN